VEARFLGMSNRSQQFISARADDGRLRGTAHVVLGDARRCRHGAPRHPPKLTRAMIAAVRAPVAAQQPLRHPTQGATRHQGTAMPNLAVP